MARNKPVAVLLIWVSVVVMSGKYTSYGSLFISGYSLNDSNRNCHHLQCVRFQIVNYCEFVVENGLLGRLGIISNNCKNAVVLYGFVCDVSESCFRIRNLFLNFFSSESYNIQLQVQFVISYEMYAQPLCLSLKLRVEIVACSYTRTEI